MSREKKGRKEELEVIKEEESENLEFFISLALVHYHNRLGRHSLRAKHGSGTTWQPHMVWHDTNTGNDLSSRSLQLENPSST